MNPEHLDRPLRESFARALVLIDCLAPAIKAREPRPIALLLPKPLVREARPS